MAKKRKNNKQEEVQVTYLSDKESENNSSIFKNLFDSLLGFNTMIILKPFWLIFFIIIRWSFIYSFNYDNFFDSLESFFGQGSISSEKHWLYHLLINLPVSIYLLSFIIWTIWITLASFKYYAFYNSFEQSDSSEIDKFLNWRDNKMKYMSYKDSVKMMNDTSILNTLNEGSKNKEVRKTLDYINNKMKYMSYPDSLKFLKGDKK